MLLHAGTTTEEYLVALREAGDLESATAFDKRKWKVHPQPLLGPPNQGIPLPPS